MSRLLVLSREAKGAGKYDSMDLDLDPGHEDVVSRNKEMLYSTSCPLYMSDASCLRLQSVGSTDEPIHVWTCFSQGLGRQELRRHSFLIHRYHHHLRISTSNTASSNHLTTSCTPLSVLAPMKNRFCSKHLSLLHP